MSGDTKVRFLFAAVTACNHILDHCRSATNNPHDSRAIGILTRRVSFAEERFHLITKEFSSRSLKADHRDAFDLVEQAYKARNASAHSGKLVLNVRSESGVALFLALATKFLRAARQAAAWLDTLSGQRR